MNADTIRTSQFSNFENAKALWSKIHSYDELMNFDQKNCPASGAYEKWRDSQRPKGKPQVKADDPDAKEIMLCHDLVLVYEVWADMYRLWRGGRMNYGGAGWNDCWPVPMGLLPVTLREMNVFTGKCDDMPDWRSDEAKRQDEADIAEGNRYRERIAKVRGEKK